MQHNEHQVRPSVNELLTDLYEITMAYSYFKQGRHNLYASFDVFFRKNPFKGQFTVLAGVTEVVNFVRDFKFKKEQLDYLRTLFPQWGDDFIDYLASLDGSQIKVFAIKDGSIVFPKMPVIRIEGPLGFAQLLETTVLNLVNFPSLMATNARRMKLAVEPGKLLIEFGLRRAQGPDGAMMATQFSYLGGFDGTSNVAGGMAYNIKVYGTMAHAYICSFKSLDEIKDYVIDGKDLKAMAVEIRKEMGYEHTNEGELAAFISYACSFPANFLALVDTYNTMHSGVPNFLAVAIAMKRAGMEPRGIRLDSGNLSSLSIEARQFIDEQAAKFGVDLSKTSIFASNDLNEETLIQLKEKGNKITSFGIGTNLVTCQAQPALGMVYKLVELEGQQCVKFSEDVEKILIPGRKNIYRLWNKKEGHPSVDVLTLGGEEIIEGKEVHIRHPGNKTLKYSIKPERVERLLDLAWDGSRQVTLNLQQAKERCDAEVAQFDANILHLKNPKEYKVLVTDGLYNAIDETMEENNIFRDFSHME